MRALLAAALVGVLHVHHAPSHDSDASFSEVLEAAHSAKLDFLVLTEHADVREAGPLPAGDRAGIYPGPDGRSLLVLVGAELTTRDGHLLGLAIPRLVPALDRPGREVIDAIHALGGFAVVPHPFSHGGWKDWEAPFDGIEVHNNATSLRRSLGPLLPLRLLRLALDRRGAMRGLLPRPERELEQWERLLLAGRPVLAFSGADAHRNVSLFGWQIDPYVEIFRSVQTLCPEGPLTPESLWRALREGRCWIRYSLFADRAAEAEVVTFPSGRIEHQLDGGRRVFEIRSPPRLLAR